MIIDSGNATLSSLKDYAFMTLDEEEIFRFRIKKRQEKMS